jgi:hypothetical protein
MPSGGGAFCFPQPTPAPSVRLWTLVPNRPSFGEVPKIHKCWEPDRVFIHWAYEGHLGGAMPRIRDNPDRNFSADPVDKSEAEALRRLVECSEVADLLDEAHQRTRREGHRPGGVRSS